MLVLEDHGTTQERIGVTAFEDRSASAVRGDHLGCRSAEGGAPPPEAEVAYYRQTERTAMAA